MMRSVRYISLLVVLLLTACGVSQAEKRKQLGDHLSAHQRARVSPGNAASIIASSNKLLNPDPKVNSFYEVMSEGEKQALKEVGDRAREVLLVKTTYESISREKVSRKNASSVAKKSKELLSSPQVRLALTQADYSNLQAVNKGATAVALAAAADKPPVPDYCDVGSVMDTAFKEFPGNAHYEVPFNYCRCYRGSVDDTGHTAARRKCLAEYSGAKILVQEDEQDKENRWICSKFYSVPPSMQAVCSRYGY